MWMLKQVEKLRSELSSPASPNRLNGARLKVLKSKFTAPGPARMFLPPFPKLNGVGSRKALDCQILYHPGSPGGKSAPLI